MTTFQSPYVYIQKGRSVYTIFVAALTAGMAFWCFMSGDPIFMLISIFFVFLVLNCIYGILKGETWTTRVEDGILSWSFARWPKSSGQIDLNTVQHIVVSDCGNTLSMTFLDGSTRRIKFVGYGIPLRDYLTAHFPHLKVEYEPGT